MPLTEVELMSFEDPIELAFVAMLAARGFTNAFESRSVLLAESPWIDCMLTTGPVIHYRPIPHLTTQSRGAFLPDEWQSQMRFDIKTVRESDEISPAFKQHKQLIGLIRSVCIVKNLRTAFRVTEASQLYAITDCGETGSSSSFDDQNNLDITTLSFTLKHNIRSDIEWPTT